MGGVAASPRDVPPSPGRHGYLRNMVKVSVMPRTLWSRLSSLWGSSFRNRTASTSIRKMARILFCRVGNSPASQEQRVSCRRKSRTGSPTPHAHWIGLDAGVRRPPCTSSGGRCLSDRAGLQVASGKGGGPLRLISCLYIWDKGNCPLRSFVMNLARVPWHTERAQWRETVTRIP